MMTRDEYREYVLEVMIGHQWDDDMGAAADEIADHYATMVDLPAIPSRPHWPYADAPLPSKPMPY